MPADCRDLLPGDQIDPGNPRRWLHAADEMGVPAGMSEARWAVRGPHDRGASQPPNQEVKEMPQMNTLLGRPFTYKTHSENAGRPNE